MRHTRYHSQRRSLDATLDPLHPMEGGRPCSKDMNNSNNCTYCGWPLDNSGGRRTKTTPEYPFRAPMEDLCTHAACWTARNTSREGMQILGPALRVTRRGREEADLPTRRSWLEGYP